MAEPFTVLIMAAGQGTRMRSETPKVLHPVCGKPMVEWVIDAAREAGAGAVVCVARPGDGVAEGLPDGVEVAEQTEGEGTGAAVLAAREHVDRAAPWSSSRATTRLSRPSTDRGAGRQPRAAGGRGHDAHHRGARPRRLRAHRPRPRTATFERIVETKYTDGVPAEELAIREINLGTYAFEARGAVRGARRRSASRAASATSPASSVLRERGRGASRRT